MKYLFMLTDLWNNLLIQLLLREICWIETNLLRAEVIANK